MKKYEIVKENFQFNDIINSGSYFKNKYYYIYYKKDLAKDFLFPKFGFAVSKKCGNAVERNKLKRQIRFIIDNHKVLFKKGYQYIIVTRKSIKDIEFKKMEESLVSLMNERNIKNEKI